MNPSSHRMLSVARPLLFVLALCALLLVGCARHYKITMSNGNEITTTSKPRLDKATGAFHYKDAQGKPASLPSFRVREIEAL